MKLRTLDKGTVIIVNGMPWRYDHTDYLEHNTTLVLKSKGWFGERTLRIAFPATPGSKGL